MSDSNKYGQGASHAVDKNDSIVPEVGQKAVPKKVEKTLPDELHNTDNKNVSHATGKSIVPEPLQRILPKEVEEAVPNAIHDTSGK